MMGRLQPGSYRTGWFPVAPAAVDAADLGLGARQGQTLEVWPGGGDDKKQFGPPESSFSLERSRITEHSVCRWFNLELSNEWTN